MYHTGAVRWLLDIAAEQEQKELLLVYSFLWNGQPVPQVRRALKFGMVTAIGIVNMLHK